MVEGVTVREVFLEEATFLALVYKNHEVSAKWRSGARTLLVEGKQRLEREHDVQEVSVKPRN